MARGNMIVSVVDVGQGQCTFVEIWNSANTKIVETLLFDCGTDHESTTTQRNLQYIANQVQTMDTPTISCIFFSHSDDDHISLTIKLLQKFPTKPKVAKVWYAGEYGLYEKRKTNVLDYLVKNKYCKQEDISTIYADYTGYSKTKKDFDEYLWKNEDNSVYVYPIVGNVIGDNDADIGSRIPLPPGRTKYPEPKNRVSLICGLYYRDNSHVICGDATLKTMTAVNTVFLGGTSVFDSNVMTTLPHHGSRTTAGFEVSSMKSVQKNKAIIKSFATITNAQMITVSAYEEHNHPSMELMEEFPPIITTPVIIDPRLEGKNVHYINGYQDLGLSIVGSKKRLHASTLTFESETNIYSTAYAISGSPQFSYNFGDINAKAAKGVTVTTPPTPINEFACWIFEVNISGSKVRNYVSGVPYLGGTMFTGAPTTAVAALRSDERSIPTHSPSQHNNLIENQTTESLQIRTKQRVYQALPQSRFMRSKSFSI